MSPSRRLAGLGPSPIRKISDFAPRDAIPLGLGAPTWSMPEVGRLALELRDEVCPYGPNAGREDLRMAIGALYGREAKDVLVTVGSQEALFSLFLAHLDPGDALLIPDPGFPAYEAIAKIAGAEVARFPLSEANSWRLDADTFQAALARNKNIKVALINHPGNPTGGGVDRAALQAVAAECEKRGVLLVSDEVYRDLYFGSRPPSLLDVTKKGVVISSISKGWGSPGLRLGWVVGDAEAISNTSLMHNYTVTSAAWTSQMAALALIRSSELVLAAARAEVTTRFQALSEAFERELGIKIAPPAGSFYCWTKLPEHARVDPFGFALKLRDEAKVVIIPGAAFGDQGKDFVRISFAALPEEIREGVRRLKPYWHD